MFNARITPHVPHFRRNRRQARTGTPVFPKQDRTKFYKKIRYLSHA